MFVALRWSIGMVIGLGSEAGMTVGRNVAGLAPRMRFAWTIASGLILEAEVAMGIETGMRVVGRVWTGKRRNGSALLVEEGC